MNEYRGKHAPSSPWAVASTSTVPVRHSRHLRKSRRRRIRTVLVLLVLLIVFFTRKRKPKYLEPLQ